MSFFKDMSLERAFILLSLVGSLALVFVGLGTRGELKELEAALENGRVALLPRLGQRKSESILREIRASRTKDDRVPIARAMPAAERVMVALRERCPSITRLEAAGSLRRFEETISDIDPLSAYTTIHKLYTGPSSTPPETEAHIPCDNTENPSLVRTIILTDFRARNFCTHSG